MTEKKKKNEAKRKKVHEKETDCLSISKLHPKVNKLTQTNHIKLKPDPVLKYCNVDRRVCLIYLFKSQKK